MFKRFLLLKTILAFAFCFAVHTTFAEGVLVFQVTNPQNKPLKDVKIDLKGGSISDQVLTTDKDGKYTNAKFPTGTYSYNVRYGDWAKGTVEVPEAEFGWVNVNFRELTIHFSNDKGEPLVGKSAEIFHIQSDGQEEFISIKYSDSTGNVKFTLPEGDYAFNTLKGKEKVTLDDENKTKDVSVTSGIITHYGFFEFQREGKPEKTWAKDILVYQINNGTATPYGSMDAHGPDIDINKWIEYDRAVNKVSLRDGIYIYEVSTKDYGTIKDTFEVKENDAIESLIIPIPLPDPIGGGNGGGNHSNIPPIKRLDSLLIPMYTLTVQFFDKNDPTKPVCNLVSYIEEADSLFVSSFNTSNSNGEAIFGLGGEANLDIYYGDSKDHIGSVNHDTTIIRYVSREDYTELFYELQYDHEKFNPTTVKRVEFTGEIHNERGVMSSTFFLFPNKKSTIGDTLYYDEPVRVGSGFYYFGFEINEMRYSNRLGSMVNVPKGMSTQYAMYNLIPIYEVNLIVCKSDTISRYINAFSGTVKDANGSSSFDTKTNGEYLSRHPKGEVCYQIVKKKICADLTSDTTLYVIYDDIVQNVYYRFVHNGEIVEPQIMSLSLTKFDTVVNEYGNKTVEGSKYAIVPSEKVSKNGLEYFVFRKPMVLPNSNYRLDYKMNDFFYNGDCKWDFDIHSARGTDTTIYIIIPVKRNVEISIKDALGNEVEGVFGKILKYDDVKKEFSEDTNFDQLSHYPLRSDVNGIIRDNLLPGLYQIQILDIVRNFIVGDYDLKFDIMKGDIMKHVRFIVKNKNSNTPMQGLELVVTKDSSMFNTDYTSNMGEINMDCEQGNYAYNLNYGKGHEGSYEVVNDTTIYILVEDEVKVSDIKLEGIDCLPIGGSSKLIATITPDSATRKAINWSISNDLIAKVNTEGNIEANKLGIEGDVIVKATTTDDSEVFAIKTIQIGGEQCGSELEYTFEDSTKTTERTGDTTKIIIKPTDKKFDLCYAVQEKQGENWVVIAGPTKDTTILINTEKMNEKEHIIRIISGTDCEKVGKGEIVPDSVHADKIGEEITITNKSIYFEPGVYGICERQDNVTLTINGENLSSLSEGTSIVWYTQKEGKSTFTEVPSAKGKTEADLSIEGATLVKVALVKDGKELSKAQKQIASEDSIKIKVNASKSLACLSDTVKINATILSGKPASVLWEDSTSELSRVVKADTITYRVVAASELGYCPDAIDSVKITIDNPIDVTISSDRDYVCDDSSNVVLSIVSAKDRDDLVYAWNGFSATGDTLHAAPEETTTYEAKVSTKLGACPSVDLSQEVKVSNNVMFWASVNKDTICEGDTIKIDINTNLYVPMPINMGLILDNDSVFEGFFSIVPSKSQYVFHAFDKNGVCADQFDTVNIAIDKAIEGNVALTSDRKFVCEDSSNVILSILNSEDRDDLVYEWNGFSATGDTLHAMPTQTTTYEAKVSTKLGACPSINLAQDVKVSGNVKFTTSLSADTVCEGETITFNIKTSAINSIPENMTLTLDDKGISSITVDAVADKSQFVFHAIDKDGACAETFDTVSIVIDKHVNVTIDQSAKNICAGDSVTLTASFEAGNDYKFNWNNGESAKTIKVAPKANAKYYLMANSQLGKCASDDDTISIYVNQPIKLQLSADADRICQLGEDSIHLTAIAEEGNPTSWIWWDGEITKTPERIIKPQASGSYWVKGNDNICPVSDTSNFTITVDVPRKAHIATTSTQFVYGGTVDLVASFDGSIEGPLHWFSVDKDGNELDLDETKDYMFTNMPSQDVTYYFVANNGSCQDVKSDKLFIALTDNITIPTVFTPHEKNGENDDFMPGYEVLIYDRYGNLIHRGSNGWDGSYKGETADAGVYVYSLTLKDGRVKKGTIQVFKK